jgi:Beta/Gamma crystallin
MPHCILFELANFRGAHRHVFVAESDLGASEDPSFNNRTSSIVILEGDWEFFSGANFSDKVGNRLGPGAYPFVANIGMKNDAISSLRPVQ